MRHLGGHVAEVVRTGVRAMLDLRRPRGVLALVLLHGAASLAVHEVKTNSRHYRCQVQALPSSKTAKSCSFGPERRTGILGSAPGALAGLRLEDGGRSVLELPGPVHVAAEANSPRLQQPLRGYSSGT